MLQKLCHDLMAVLQGAAPRFFEPADLPKRLPTARALSDWAAALARSRRSAEHPLNAGLMLESLVSQAQRTLNSGA
jgi:DNA polymerase-3 subunit delta'